MDALPVELVDTIFSFAVLGWNVGTYSWLCISRRIEDVRRALCEEPPGIFEYSDVHKLLRYLARYPNYAQCVRHFQIDLYDEAYYDYELNSNKLENENNTAALSQLLLLCVNAPFNFSGTNGHMWELPCLRHIRILNTHPNFLLPLLERYLSITTFEILGADGDDRGWLGNAPGVFTLKYSTESSKDDLQANCVHDGVLSKGLRSLLMPAKEYDSAATTIQDVLVSLLHDNFNLPPLQILELALFEYTADDLLFPLLLQIQASIKVLRLSGSEESIDPDYGYREADESDDGAGSAHFYELLEGCKSLQVLHLAQVGLSGWKESSRGYFTSSVRELVLDKIEGYSIDISLWEETFKRFNPPISTITVVPSFDWSHPVVSAERYKAMEGTLERYNITLQYKHFVVERKP
ncbi:hypothetical protein BT69DRAFT_1276386 [Atractiella rhizophila]|nr:hypothetical protein BT69DRAFT_1276386 [Atractiella rhizophila]